LEQQEEWKTIQYRPIHVNDEPLYVKCRRSRMFCGLYLKSSRRATREVAEEKT
jgi:hypothetical protein